MRPDMADLIVEKPRHGSYFMSGLKTRMRVDSRDQTLDDQNYPRRISHKEVPSRSRKSQSDRLSPLFRFLEKSVGRRWNEVYSEIVWAVSRKTLRGHRLFQHLGYYVSGHILDSSGPFFVDANGILRVEKKRTYRPANFGKVSKIVISDTLHLELREDFWFEVRFVKHPAGEFLYAWLDENGETHIKYREHELLEQVSCKQMNHRQLRVVRKILDAPKSTKKAGRNPLAIYTEKQYGALFVDRNVIKDVPWAA
ncbi:MAG: hypothetical protein Q8P56_03605 [Candidatus Uhrbacteria bacterium]|nr:hypothetical protein [Candidatus Uhrbacteria bacterium]